MLRDITYVEILFTYKDKNRIERPCAACMRVILGINIPGFTDLILGNSSCFCAEFKSEVSCILLFSLLLFSHTHIGIPELQTLAYAGTLEIFDALLRKDNTTSA